LISFVLALDKRKTIYWAEMPTITTTDRAIAGPPPERQRQNRRRHPQRVNRHNNGYYKSLLHFSTFHIVLGIFGVFFQMVQFTNQTILSSAESGLWCGLFFVVTGAACLLLYKLRTTYSLLTMITFSLVSLFMALTLSSVSWIGMEAISYCEYVWEECVANRTDPTPNATIVSTPYGLPIKQWAFQLGDSSGLIPTQIDPDITSEICDEIEFEFLCGYSISLGKTMHSLLMLVGLLASTTSFVLVTVSCSGAKQNDMLWQTERVSRLSIVFRDGSNEGGGTVHGRPITPWEFPPPAKDPLPLDQYPDEPPPLYVQYEDDITSNL